MSNAEATKQLVREKYGEIALTSSPCCRSGTAEVTPMNDDYSQLPGYVAEADLGLGCGIPTDVAKLQPGETVLDLGAGAGNDVFVARSYVGENGYVIGLDMTQPMLDKAVSNAAKLGYTNVEFRLGDIEAMPIDDNTIDVVISNCVLNLVPDKAKAFTEIHRVLKPGGRFCISDIVVTRELPQGIRADVSMYVGCVAGAILQDAYLDIIAQIGFANVTIAKSKRYTIPHDLLAKHLDEQAIETFGTPVTSITVVGEKA